MYNERNLVTYIKDVREIAWKYTESFLFLVDYPKSFFVSYPNDEIGFCVESQLSWDRLGNITFYNMSIARTPFLILKYFRRTHLC